MRLRSRSQKRRREGPDSIFKNAASTFVGQMTTASLTAVLTLFLVRQLGAKQYGIFALTLGMSSIAIAFFDLGISDSTARFAAEHRGRGAQLGELVADALKLKVVLTGLLCAVFAVLASVIAGLYGNHELVWPLRGMALAVLGQSTYLMLLGISAALGRAAVNVRLVAAESLLEVSSSVGLVLAGAGAAGAAFGRAIGYVLGAAIAAFVVLRLSGHGTVRLWRLPRRETVRRVGGYAGPLFAIDVSYTISTAVSILLLGAYVGSVGSGVYQAPLKLITLIQYVGLSTAYGVTPRLTRGPGQEPNVAALNGALRGLIGFQCLMLAPAVVWAGPITHILLGSGYSRSADVLAALAPYIFFSGLVPLVTGSVSYLGEAGRRVPIAFATLALIAVGGVVLIPRYGVVGAAIATDIAFGFYTLAHIWLCRRLLKLRLGMLLWSLACGLTAAGAMGVVLAYIGTKHMTILSWLEGGAGGVAAYVGMLIFTREIRGSHIASVLAMLRPYLARLHLAPSPRRSPPPATPGHNPAATVTSRIEDPARRISRLPAATPPVWVQGQLSEPAGLVETVAPERSAAIAPAGRHRQETLDPERNPRSRPDPVYQIGWRLGQESGVFELRPVGSASWPDSAPNLSLAARQSPPVYWGWRLAPAPTPEAREAHAALVAGLLATGWQRAGSGDTWFAQRFRSPDQPHSGEVRDGES